MLRWPPAEAAEPAPAVARCSTILESSFEESFVDRTASTPNNRPSVQEPHMVQFVQHQVRSQVLLQCQLNQLSDKIDSVLQRLPGKRTRPSAQTLQGAAVKIQVSSAPPSPFFCVLQFF